jgi:hypothetical protein
MKIVRGNNPAWTGQFLTNATRAAKRNGLLAAEPTEAQNGIINNDENSEFFFNSTFTLRYDADQTPFTTSESTTQNTGGLPAPITMQSLRQCTGAMESEADAENENSETGVRSELRSLNGYAEKRGTRIFTHQGTAGFWVAVQI